MTLSAASLCCVFRAKKFHGLPAGSSGGHSGKLPVSDKLSKGLRHFSWRVCEKVQQKKVTTYNEVCVCVCLCLLATGGLVVLCSVSRVVFFCSTCCKAVCHPKLVVHEGMRHCFMLVFLCLCNSAGGR